jgi:hypothetical protein
LGTELPPHLRARFMWRRLESFEVENYLVYCPTRYTQFVRSVRGLAAEVAVLGKTCVTAFPSLFCSYCCLWLERRGACSVVSWLGLTHALRG